MAALPVIGITADRRMVGPHPFHMVGEKYAHAVARASHALPLLIPVLPEPLEVDDLLDSIDGLLLPGSPSNVEPHHYDEGPSEPGTLHDPERDATTLPLIRRAIERGVPVLAICRGSQEMNVALGGSLWQRVHEVYLTEGGWFRAWADGAESIRVNSLHGQGVKRLAPGLIIEAKAPDGLIEAFRIAASPAFAVGVQWHPEWRVMANPFSVAMFEAFGDAARSRSARRSAARG